MGSAKPQVVNQQHLNTSLLLSVVTFVKGPISQYKDPAEHLTLIHRLHMWAVMTKKHVTETVV